MTVTTSTEIEQGPDARGPVEASVKRSFQAERTAQHWCQNEACEWHDADYDERCAKESGMESAIWECPDYQPMKGRTCERCGDFVPAGWLHGCA
jgi:hypothetical protein